MNFVVCVHLDVICLFVYRESGTVGSLPKKNTLGAYLAFLGLNNGRLTTVNISLGAPSSPPPTTTHTTKDTIE